MVRYPVFLRHNMDTAEFFWKSKWNFFQDLQHLCGRLNNDGNLSFQEHTKSTSKLFYSKRRVQNDFDFFASDIQTIKYWTFTVTQKYYSSTLKPSSKQVKLGNLERRGCWFHRLLTGVHILHASGI